MSLLFIELFSPTSPSRPILVGESFIFVERWSRWNETVERFTRYNAIFDTGFLVPRLCSSHHIAVWRKNVSNSYLGPPWKVLCQQSESTVVVDDGQALIEFRSGSNTSPYLYTGFRASVEFLHSTAVVVPTAFSPKRTILAVEPSRHQDVEVVVGKKSPPASGSAKSRSNQKKHGEKPSEEPARPISSTG